jgi:serine/threonine-protein kinase
MPATNELLQEGRYRINQSSTNNGDETVFEAYDTVRNTNVIVREIPVKLNRVTTVSQQESLKLAFATQAKALTEIEHDALLHVHDFFSEIDRQYLVMEAVEGDNLSDLLVRNKKPFAVSQVNAWADELLDALNYLHTRKPSIVHRNISPANLKLDSSGKVKLSGFAVGGGPDSDFGVRSQTEGDALRYSPMEQIWPGLDAASQKVITNSYDDRSERILKEPLDARSDIYSLGATLYFLMTGVEPVDPIERSIEILEGKLDPLREPTKVDSNIPPEISDVLMKALEIKRENRYDSAFIMRQVLQSAIARVQERETQESHEQKEAAEFLRQATLRSSDPAGDARRQAEAEEQKQQAAEVERKRIEAATAEQQRRVEAEAVEQKRLEAEAAEKQRVAEEQKRQAHEAEELRKKEEQERLARQAEEERKAAADRKAEAERLLREEQQAAEAAMAARTEESVLDIPAAAEVVAYRDSSASVEEDELAAVLRELEEAENSAQPSRPIETNRAENVAPVSVEAEDDDGDIFSVPEKSGFSIPMPAIAGAIGLVIVAVIGWFAMSGSSEQPKQPEPQPVQIAQPAPVEEAPVSTDPAASTPSDSNTAAAEPAAAASDQTAAQKAAAAAKAKKEANKPAPEKKKVTVDDLINDN